MRLFVVSMFDKAAAVYGPPICVASVGQAVRSFGDQVNGPVVDSMVARHPSDFELYQVGFYDDATGRFDNVVPAPAFLVAGSSLVKVGGV